MNVRDMKVITCPVTGTTIEIRTHADLTEGRFADATLPVATIGFAVPAHAMVFPGSPTLTGKLTYNACVRLRDALIALFPLPAPPKPVTTYRVEPAPRFGPGAFEVVKESRVERSDVETKAVAYDEATAEMIRDGLSRREAMKNG